MRFDAERTAFLGVDVTEISTANYWRSRVATYADLKQGQVVFIPDRADGEVYRAPASRDEVVGSWWMARITDLSELAAGFVTVSGLYKVRSDALRVPQ